MNFDNAIEITHEQCMEMLYKWMENNYDKSIPEKQFWYYYKEEGIEHYVVIDNNGNDFLMEDFKTPEAAHAWLRNIDVDICYKVDKLISESIEYEQYESEDWD